MAFGVLRGLAKGLDGGGLHLGQRAQLGAHRPYQVCTSYAGRPTSAALGTSGMAGLRLLPATISALMEAALDVAGGRTQAVKRHVHGAGDQILQRRPPAPR